MTNSLRKNRKGFTLLELLIALALLTVVVFMLLSLFDFGSKTFIQQSDEITASAEIENAMDRILTELRKAARYNTESNQIVGSRYDSVIRLDGSTLKMIRTYHNSGERYEIVLCYDISSITFDMESDKIKIGIYSNKKNSKGEYIKLESEYFLRQNYE